MRSLRKRDCRSCSVTPLGALPGLRMPPVAKMAPEMRRFASDANNKPFNPSPNSDDQTDTEITLSESPRSPEAAMGLEASRPAGGAGGVAAGSPARSRSVSLDANITGSTSARGASARGASSRGASRRAALWRRGVEAVRLPAREVRRALLRRSRWRTPPPRASQGVALPNATVGHPALGRLYRGGRLSGPKLATTGPHVGRIGQTLWQVGRISAPGSMRKQLLGGFGARRDRRVSHCFLWHWVALWANITSVDKSALPTRLRSRLRMS